MNDADKELTVNIDFDLAENELNPEEIQMIQMFMADLIGEALRLSDFNEE